MTSRWQKCGCHFGAYGGKKTKFTFFTEMKVLLVVVVMVVTFGGWFKAGKQMFNVFLEKSKKKNSRFYEIFINACEIRNVC